MKGRLKTNLGDILENRGLKQKWVAEQIGAKAPQVNNWCKNDKDGYAVSTPNALYMVRLEKLLGLSASQMFEEINV